MQPRSSKLMPVPAGPYGGLLFYFQIDFFTHKKRLQSGLRFVGLGGGAGGRGREGIDYFKFNI